LSSFIRLPLPIFFTEDFRLNRNRVEAKKGFPLKPGCYNSLIELCDKNQVDINQLQKTAKQIICLAVFLRQIILKNKKPQPRLG